MAPIYNPTQAHPLVSPKAANLTAQAFELQLVTAETLLGIPEPASEDEGVIERFKLALVHQVNFQVQQGLDPLIQESGGSQHSGNSAKYRDRVINPVAKQIVDEVLAVLGINPWSGIALMTSHRKAQERTPGGYPIGERRLYSP